MVLANCDRRTVERRVRAGKYEALYADSKKQKSKTVMKILTRSLPVEMQVKLMQSRADPLDPPTATCQAVAADIGPAVEQIKNNNTQDNHAAWYQSLPPEHLQIIEKRLAIITHICNAAAAENKNKTEIITHVAAAQGINAGTFYRWKKAHDAAGLYGLRHKSYGTTRAKLTQQQRNYIVSLIRYNPDCRDTRVWEYLADEFPADEVSGATVKRYVAKWKMENAEVYTYLSNPDKWKNNYMLASGSHSEKAKHFLHYVELDSTPSDVMCKDGKRYTIIGGIDIYSRKAKCYVSPSSSGMGVAALIRSIITTWGVPENFIRDNGKDYICRQVNFALQNLAINAVTLPPFTPEGKPHIERFFRTMSISLFEEVEGYIGHNVTDRRAIESRRTFAQRLMRQGDDPVRLNLMPTDLQDMIDNWIDNIYHQRTHSSINATPEHKAAQSPVPVRRIADARALDILLLPAGTRSVQKSGICFEGGQYQSPLFAAGWVGRKVLVRRDIDNAGLLYVFDLDHNFICAATDARIGSMTSEDHTAAKKEQRRLVKEKVKAIAALTESPMQRRLRNAKNEKKIIALSPARTHSTEALEQAGNAALSRNGIRPKKYKSVAQQMRGDESFDTDTGEDEDPLAFLG